MYHFATEGSSDIVLPNLSEGQDPQALIVQYQDGILAKTTKLGDVSGRLDVAYPDVASRPANVASLLC